MTNAELAAILLQNPDAEISASLDIETKVFDKHGDEIIAKIHGYSLCEAIQIQPSPNSSVQEIVLLFEQSGAGNGIDVIETISNKLKEK